MPNESDNLKGRVWPEGTAFWFIHGVRVTQQIVEAPETLMVAQIRDETNLEVRRVMLDRFGEDRYIRERGIKPIAKDDWGELFRADLAGDEPLTLVRVLNSTLDPDGSAKPYYLRVDPQYRIMHGDGKYGPAQKPTPLNMIAATFGMTGEEYCVIEQQS